MFDANKVKNECVEWIREFFKGTDCNAVIGISGGKDSSVAAALCVEALGKERVIGVLMPQGEQHDIDMAYLLVNTLGIKHYVVNIKDAVDAIIRNMPENMELSTQSRVNLPPRIRMTTLYAVSQSNNGRVCNTCNLSEDWVGYSTRYGDSVGDFSPMSHLTVTEVKEIGYLLGLPKELVDKHRLTDFAVKQMKKTSVSPMQNLMYISARAISQTPKRKKSLIKNTRQISSNLNLCRHSNPKYKEHRNEKTIIGIAYVCRPYEFEKFR